MGQMSNDRVRFTLPSGYYRNGSDCRAYQQLLDDVFGLCVNKSPGPQYEDLVIVCRPSQFARFLIERHRRGISNQFAVLCPVLFQPEAAPDYVDVSGNPARPDRISYTRAKTA